MKEAIRTELGKLINLKRREAGRASNLLWVGFRERILVKRRGEAEEVAEYALHIQCSWRITRANKIIVASKDFYSPVSECDVEEGFDWDEQGSNRFDERITSFIEGVKEELIVERIDSDELGGLKIFLSESYVLEVFPDSSQDDEYSEFWRFFNRKSDTPHFIVSGNGIETV
jgi:hypothetical protein